MAETATAPEVTKEASVGTVEAREASDAQAWESITGQKPDADKDIPVPDFAKLEAEGKTEDGTPRGPDGKFVKPVQTKPVETKKVDVKSATDKKAEDGSKESPKAKKDDKPPDREQRRKIIAAKEVVGRVLKWSDEKLDATDPEALIELGQSLKPVFSTVESLKTDLQKWKDKARGQKANDLDTPDNGRGRTAEPDDEAETEPAERDTGGTDQLLRNYLDPDTYSQVKRAQRAERARFQDQAAKATERAETAEARGRLDRIEVGRDRVAEKFPQLKDDARFERLLEAMDEMDPEGVRATGDLASFVKFMERVAWTEFGEEVEETTRKRLITGNRKDAASQPETTSHGSQPSTMSWDEYENYAAWASVEANGNRAKLDALLARVKRPARPN